MPQLSAGLLCINQGFIDNAPSGLRKKELWLYIAAAKYGIVGWMSF
jgi:hypothetical protein